METGRFVTSSSSSDSDTSACFYLGSVDCFYTAKVDESPSITDEDALEETETVGADSASTSERSEYYSARCETMMQSRDKFSDEVEFEIEFSKPHWSEVTRLAPLSNEEEEQNRENWEVYAELLNDPECGEFFRYWSGYYYELGRRIAKGGQAEIFEVINYHSYLMKVFERGSLLQLRQLWPLQVLKGEVRGCIRGGVMLEDGRFAFLMDRCWGDLRKLIDQAMGCQGPPFPYVWNGATMHAGDIMWNIADQMDKLHKKGIFHRDLKASNILLLLPGMNIKRRDIIIADFECSIGVFGTGFWRAPEILLALETKEALTEKEWEKADVYSYGMTCYEIMTGRLPFDGELKNTRGNRNLVIKGQRPKLPSNLKHGVKDLITSCWDPNPTLRPTFSQVVKLVEGMKRGCHFRLFNSQDKLPPQYRLATLEDVYNNRCELLLEMPGYETANLANGFVYGARYGCLTRPEKCSDATYKLARIIC